MLIWEEMRNFSSTFKTCGQVRYCILMWKKLSEYVSYIAHIRLKN